MNNIEAMKQALEAWDAFGENDDFDSLFLLTSRMNTLRTAIEQAEKQEPSASRQFHEWAVAEHAKLNATQPSSQPAPVQEQWFQAVTDKIEAKLLSHQLSLHDDADRAGTGYPLVDALCCGQKDLEIGKQEIKDIAEMIYHVLTTATPPAQPAPVQESLTDAQVAAVLGQLPVPSSGGHALHDWAMQAVRELDKLRELNGGQP